MRVVRSLVLGCAVVFGASGCAGSVRTWIVQTRDHQGDIARAHGNDADASQAYRLALEIDPHDAHAREGYVATQIRLAQKAFAASKFDDAITALAYAQRVAPQDERVDGLRTQIEQAEIKRDIVVSNYPNYRETGASLRRAYKTIGENTKKIVGTLGTFDYTYDTAALSRAIRESYALDAEVARVTNRLVQYRQLVESGLPEATKTEQLAPPASLLPLP